MKRRQSHKLAELAALAALVSERSLGPVAAAQREIEAAEADLARLAEYTDLLSSDATDPVQAALVARQMAEMGRQRAAVLSRLARCMAELEQAKAAARPDFGRRMALERLLSADRTSA